MKIEHLTDNPALMWSWYFETIIDDLLRYYTYVDIYDNTFQITDRWTEELFVKEKFNNENEIYLKVEELAKQQENILIKNKIIKFNKTAKPSYSNDLKDKIFDAWLYNTDIYNQVRNIENTSDNFYENDRLIKLAFNECSKYYYERTTNTIVLLDSYQVILHKHFWINIDYHNSTIDNLILKHFGNEIFSCVNNDHFYLNRQTYNTLLECLQKGKNYQKKLLNFKRIVAENWIEYTNEYFLIPISFANKDYYD